jgi:hypothetical protein
MNKTSWVSQYSKASKGGYYKVFKVKKTHGDLEKNDQKTQKEKKETNCMETVEQQCGQIELLFHKMTVKSSQNGQM